MRRALCAAVLSFEGILLWLSIPVMITTVGVPGGRAGLLGGGLGVGCFVVAGLLGRSWGYVAGHAMQIVLVCLGRVVPTMYVVGVLFAGLWIAAYVVGLKVDRARAIR